MTHYEFSWTNDAGELKHFETSDPKTGEDFMRSVTDFPQLSTKAKEAFEKIYGGQVGAFEKFLREAVLEPDTGELKSEIPGLTIRHTEW